MNSRTSSIVRSDLVLILMIGGNVGIGERIAWNGSGGNPDPSASKNISSFHIISCDFGASIATWWFPVDGNERDICINRYWTSGFTRNVILSSWSHWFIYREMANNKLGTMEKFKKLNCAQPFSILRFGPHTRFFNYC